MERAELPRRPSYFLTEGYLIDATSGMDDAKEGEEELEEAAPSFAIGSADSGTHATAKLYQFVQDEWNHALDDCTMSMGNRFS